MSEKWTDKDFENARKEALKKAISKPKPNENPQQVDAQESNVKKDEKKLDIDEKNSYIENESTENEETVDEVESKYREVLEKTFQGDPIKVAKSWSETSSAYARLRNEYQDLEQEAGSLINFIENNPILSELLERAQKGEDIQSYLKEVKEPQGKPNSSDESKLNSNDFVGQPSQEELIEAGLIRRGDMELLTEAQKQDAIRRASVQYMEQTYPKRIAQKALEEYQKQIVEANQRAEEERRAQEHRTLNNTRYTSGLEEVTLRYGDVVIQDDVLADIRRHASTILDPDNPKVISEDAVQIATDRVLRKRGVDVRPQKSIEDAKLETEQRIDKTFGKSFNANKKQTDKANSEPKTLAEKLRFQRLQRAMNDLEKRKTFRKLDFKQE